MENVIKDRAAIIRKIDSVKGRSKTLRADITTLAHITFLHAAGVSGDLTLASRLVNAVSPSHATALRRYFQHFGPVRWDKKTAQFKKLKKGGRYDVTATDYAFDADFAKDREPAEYNRAKELTAIVKFLDTRADRALNANDAEMVDVLTDVAGVLAKLIK